LEPSIGAPFGELPVESLMQCDVRENEKDNYSEKLKGLFNG